MLGIGSYRISPMSYGDGPASLRWSRQNIDDHLAAIDTKLITGCCDVSRTNYRADVFVIIVDENDPARIVILCVNCSAGHTFLTHDARIRRRL